MNQDILNSAFIASVERNAIETIRQLIALGVDVNVQDRSGKSALHISCWLKNKELATLLIESGADLNIQDIAGETALYYACSLGDKEFANFLIERGADVNVQDKYGKTALYYACLREKSELVTFIIESGATIDDKICDIIRESTRLSYELKESLLNFIQISQYIDEFTDHPSSKELVDFLKEKSVNIEYMNWKLVTNKAYIIIKKAIETNDLVEKAKFAISLLDQVKKHSDISFIYDRISKITNNEYKDAINADDFAKIEILDSLTKELSVIFEKEIIMPPEISLITLNIQTLEALVMKGLAKQQSAEIPGNEYVEIGLFTRDQMKNSNFYTSERDAQLFSAKVEFLAKNPEFHQHNYVLTNLHKLAKEDFFEKYLIDEASQIILILKNIKDASMKLGVKIKDEIKDLCKSMGILAEEGDNAAGAGFVSSGVGSDSDESEDYLDYSNVEVAGEVDSDILDLE